MKRIWILAVGAATVLAATAGIAVVPPEDDGLRAKAVQHPDLYYGNAYRPVAELPVEVSRGLTADLGSLSVDPGNAHLDLRTGRWGTLIVVEPLIPGPGVGNDLQWSSLGYQAAPQGEALEQAAWQAFHGYLVDHAVELGIDPQELGEPRVSVLGERLIQLYVGREYGGIPVRDAFVNAAINSGNLVLTGAHNWADLNIDTRPAITVSQAEAELLQHVELPAARFRAEPHLEIVPVSSKEATFATLGDGLDHRLVWMLSPEYEGDGGTWEAMVDAHSGEVLAFVDRNHYATSTQTAGGGSASRRVEGAIFPVSNDGEGDDGTLQFGYPMPFADIELDGVDVGFTSTGGNVPTANDPGTISTQLSGQFVRMNDNCGAVDESAATGDLDLDGLPLPATDCDVPAGHSAGDTSASRSGFYELNRLKEQARSYLPDNTWLDQQLTANMNINNNCNAFWNGATVNFYTSGGGCRNTGEIAAIFDHEWGHGMDDNDANPTISQPGEGIADIYAINRLNDSCVGRGFRFTNCTGYGDACLDCTGVREVDWDKHESHTPHGAQYAAVTCPVPPPGFATGPCGKATHCEGHLVSEMAWDLVHRDLMEAPYNLDLNTALELGTQLAYYGSSNVFNWYQCTSGDADSVDGCNSDSGYLGYLAADDDNGDLTDGTPHMSAIFAAFDRHDIACSTPTVQDFGCAGGPTAAPENVAADTFSEGMELTWDAVPDAAEYRIFRTEGVHGCEFGKTLVGTTTDTSFTETGLRNGFEVFYSVMAVGANDACTSAMSACASAIPSVGPSGFIEGTVTDSNGGAPIAGAAVEAVGPVTVGDETDENGFYRILAPVGTYDLTATATGYEAATETGVAVADGGTETVDFQLDLIPVPIADISPDSLTFELPQGASDDGTLSIGNVGLLDLEWSLAEDSVPAPSLGEGEDWSDNFDSYETGSQIHGQGGWKGWDNSPAAGALVSDAQANSASNSVEIVGASDLVREFENIDAGQWRVTAWQFVPSDFTGESYYILLGDYTDGGPYQWAVQVNFNGATDQVTSEGASGGSLPLVTDQWVELRVEIDLENDTQEFYYDGELLYTGTWTSEQQGGAPPEFEAIDLFANGASAVYYDDMSVVDVTVPPACAEPNDVPWLSVAPTSGVTAPGSSEPVDVAVDTTGLALGEHTAHLCVTTNDPAAELVEVPVNLTVIDGTEPHIDVDPESLESTLPVDGSETQSLTVANLGGGNLDWEVVDAPGLAQRVLSPTGGVTTPITQKLASEVRGLARAVESGVGASASHPFPLPAGGDEVVITHSDSMDVEAANAVACANEGPPQTTVDNQFLRTFTLGDFDITGDFQVTEVTFGVENLTTNVTVAVNLYTLEGPFTYANLTPIGSATVDLTPQDLSLVTAPVSGVAPAGSTLVVEIEVPTLLDEGVYFPGSNSQGETAPSYIASDTCDLSDPAPYSEVGPGFPNVHLVMAVTGAVDSLDCTLPTWLSVDPTTGSVPGGDSQLVDVTFDATGLDLGVYEATVCLASNAANSPSLEVPVSLEVVEGASLFEAASLEVDTAANDASDGNGVFEPGEQVEVIPGWHNDGTIGDLLSGTASNFTGPVGATYDLGDNGADYGEVDPGQTATCADGADCYEMSVDAPAVRPATHWVATFDEELSDGTDKTWMLHVGDSFIDVPRSNIFYRSVETLLHSGVTGGCGDSDYCPGDANSRAQMPVFMLKALEGPDYTPPACDAGDEEFGDVPASHLFCSWIEDLANRGIVSGCGDGNYCPADAVTRAQMSIFLLKTLEGSDYTPDSCSSQFDDVPCPSIFADWIEDLASRGITQGCSATEYCPGDPVSRAQMAAFISTTFGFTLYGP